jgi:site-specific recombinase XerD
MLAALNASGLRISELLNLRLHQFVGKRFVNVLCKGGKIRTILIMQEAATLIREYVERYRTSASDYLFTNRYGDKLSRNGIAGALQRIASHANVNLSADDQIELRPHLLRHRHAYKARSAHGDVFAAKRLGHSSLKHLERYAGLSEDEEQAIIENM